MRSIGPVAVFCLAASLAHMANAQAPQAPEAVREMIADLALEQGMTTFGDVHLSRLDDGDAATIKVKVAPGKRTYLTVAGDSNTLDIKARAMAGGKEFVPEMDYGAGLIAVQIPEGHGDTVSLNIQMSCEFIDCGYFVQAFVR